MPSEIDVRPIIIGYDQDDDYLLSWDPGIVFGRRCLLRPLQSDGFFRYPPLDSVHVRSTSGRIAAPMASELQ